MGVFCIILFGYTHPWLTITIGTEISVVALISWGITWLDSIFMIVFMTVVKQVTRVAKWMMLPLNEPCGRKCKLILSSSHFCYILAKKKGKKYYKMLIRWPQKVTTSCKRELFAKVQTITVWPFGWCDSHNLKDRSQITFFHISCNFKHFLSSWL